MKKVLSVAMCIAIMLSLTLETFAVSADETTDTVGRNYRKFSR